MMVGRWGGGTRTGGHPAPRSALRGPTLTPWLAEGTDEQQCPSCSPEGAPHLPRARATLIPTSQLRKRSPQRRRVTTGPTGRPGGLAAWGPWGQTQDAFLLSCSGGMPWPVFTYRGAGEEILPPEPQTCSGPRRAPYVCHRHPRGIWGHTLRPPCPFWAGLLPPSPGPKPE